jgi:hypothetical protein
MKRISKRLAAVVLCAAMLLSVTVFAATTLQGDKPAIVFDAKTQTFTINGMKVTSAEPYPDLFPDMKNLMPGDSVTQEIRVQVKNAGSNTVKLYLKAESQNDDDNDNDYETLIGTEDSKTGVTLSVKFEGTDYAEKLTYTGSITKLTESAADSDEGVYLGAFTGSDSEKDIDVTLAIPIDAGNKLQDLKAQLGWVVVAEIIPAKSSHNSIGGNSGDNLTDIADDDVPLSGLNDVDHFGYMIGSSDGNFYPNRQITRGEVATIFFRLMTDDVRSSSWSTSNAYSDVPSNMWCNNAISTLSSYGVLTGYPDGTFRPNEPITRAEFSAIALRFYTVHYSGEDKFSDIANHWARNEINGAAAAGLLEGYPDGTFRPDVNILRAEAAAIMNRVLQRSPDKDHMIAGMITWPDNMDTSAWYYSDVQEATNSHDYDYYTDNSGSENEYETWTALNDVRDWAALEKTWAVPDSGQNTATVVSSAAQTEN